MHGRPMSCQAGWGWLASGVSLVITLGTLYQRRYCGSIDWRAGNLVQFVAVAIFFATGAALFERNVVHWTSEFLLSLIWLAVMLSIGSIGLLYWLIKRSAASSVASLFYLVPAVTSIMAYVLFGERLDGIAIAGMLVCAAAVFLVNRRAQARRRPQVPKRRSQNKSLRTFIQRLLLSRGSCARRGQGMIQESRPSEAAALIRRSRISA
jgi:drug/metabolite transporter (DMT)-like permease